VTELFVAFVTAVASFLTTRGWPTLARRVKDHAAMLKEMPPEVGLELKALLAAEVAQLASRESGRLDRSINMLLNVQRGAWVVAIVGSAAVWGLIIFNPDEPSLTYGIGLIAVSALILLSLIATLVAGRMLKTRGRK
jgi:hypothetical protein